jgi:2-oxo-4-hydroxy-4-carboxy-5-ureidoimidazoline decarboxylase
MPDAMNTAHLNSLPDVQARDALLKCCHSRAWVEAMMSARPFADEAALLAACERAESAMTRDDWLEAFAGHPRIGDVEGLRRKFASTAAWASSEQAGAAAADEATLRALAEGNAEYERRYGHIFIVCATGNSAGEMLAILRGRLHNDPAAESRIAAAEQAKITRIRLAKLQPPEATP